MEQEDRKKKLAAGKEKLAAFRKKRARKKKTEGDDSQTQSVDSAQSSANDLEVSNLANVSSLSDLHSFTVESDHYSLTSGDEWSAEESDVQTSLHYQNKLAAATQRIAELEEAVEGKQLALDRMVLEVQMVDKAHKVTDGGVEEGEMQSSFKGSVSELEEALVQRDKIIRQLTAHLQGAALAKVNGAQDPVDYAEETQHLSQQVVLLQQQLTQAGERVEQQVSMCQMWVQALQDARGQILALQDKVTEKNNLLQHLSHTLSLRTTELTSLQHREAQLQHMVHTLQQQAVDGGDGVSAAQTQAARVATLELELERLGSEHAHSLQSVSELRQQLQVSESTCQALVSEKELALEKIVGLEDELCQLAAVRDDALRKMSDLEQQVQEGSMLIQAQSHFHAEEAGERVAQLEQQIVELNEQHRLQVHQLQLSLGQSSEPPQTDLHNLKNVINSQQGEVLSLQEQLKHKEDELAASRQQLQSLQDQLDDLHSQYQQQQSEATQTVLSWQQQVQELRDENSRYRQQMARVQEQVCSFRECLQFSPPGALSSRMGQDANNCGVFSSDGDVTDQLKQLQASFTYLLTQYSDIVERSNHIQSEVQTASQATPNILERPRSEEQKDGTDTAVETEQLQCEVAKWMAAVQERDAQMEALTSQLQSVSEEKQRLAFLVQQQEQVTEQQTLHSDTLHRRMESRVNSLFTEVTEYKEALKESELANIELQDKMDVLSKETGALKLQLAASEDLMKELQGQLNAKSEEHRQTESKLQERLKEKTQCLSQLQEELQGKETCLSQLQVRLEERDSAQSHMQGQFLEKDSCLSQLQDQLKEKDSSISQLQEQLHEKDSSISQMQEQLHEKDSSISQMQEQLQEKDSSISQLQEQLLEKDSSISQLQEQLHEKDSSISQLEEQLQEKDSSISKLQEKDSSISKLQEQLQEKDSSISLLQEQLHEKDSSVSQLKEKDSSISQLQEQLQEKDSSISHLQEQLQEKDSSISKLQEQLQENDSSVSQLQEQLQEKDSSISQLQEQLQEKDSSISQLQEQLQEKDSSISQLQEQLQEKDSSISQLQEELHEKDGSILQLQEQLQEKDSSILQLQEQLQEKDSSISQLQEIISQLQEELQEKDSSISQLQEQLQEKDSSISQLQEQLQEKDSSISQLQEQLQAQDSSISQLQEQLQEKDSCVSQLQEQLEAQAEENSGTVRVLHDQLSEKEKSLSQIQEQIENKQTSLFQLEEVLEEKEKSLSQLKEDLEERDQQLEKLRDKLDSTAEEVGLQNSRLSEDLEHLHQQLAEARKQHQTALMEQEQLVCQHEELRCRLEEKCAEMKRAVTEKEETEASLASAEGSKLQEILKITEELEKMSAKLDELKAEKETLLMELSSLKDDGDAEKEKHSRQIEEMTERMKQAKEEKEEIVSVLEVVKDENCQQLKQVQQKLDHSNEQYQTLLYEKEKLCSQQTAVTEKCTHLQDQLQVKQQEYNILLAENEQLHEELQSCSSAYIKENKNLKAELLEQSQKFDVLHSEFNTFQDQLLSREAEFSCELRKAQQKLREKVKETEAVKQELRDMEQAGISKENSNKNLRDEVDSLKEKLVQAESTCLELSQDREGTVEGLRGQVHDLEQELVSAQEEKEVITSRLAAQADMFRVKQEEMVAENNTLNHQLEEVRNDAEETVHQLQKQLDDLQSQLRATASRLESQDEEVTKLKEELETSRASLQIQENELGSFKEEGSKYKDELDSLTASNDVLGKEKEQLLVKIQSLESSVEAMQKQCDEEVAALHKEIQQLGEDRDLQLSECGKERSLLAEQNTALQQQLESCTSQIESLQRSLKDSVEEQERLKTESSRLQQQTHTLQMDLSSQIEHVQLELAAKDGELQTVQSQLRDSQTQLTQQLESLQEELAAAQSEMEQKESRLITAKEDLLAVKQQLEHAVEEKEMLKSNFDSCMEDMTQRAADRDTTIQQLQGRLVEASQSVDRDQGQLREMYEAQLSELEDRLAAADLESQRLERQCDNISMEKDKLKDKYDSHLAELELTMQAAESESCRLKEQVAKMSDSHEKEMADLKHSCELQLSSMEENYQSLEKAFAKQDAVLADAGSKNERERAEREKVFDQQLSEAYEQARMYEMDISRLKRQLDEMRKDHQMELQETQKALENQVFDLENKCVLATSELERVRQSLWGMEQDHSGEVQALQHRVQELEALSRSQDIQLSDLQDSLAQSSQMSDDSIVSLKESHQCDVAHLQEVTQRLKGDVEMYQSQLKALQNTHRQELEAQKREHGQQVAEVQEKCRQAENYSSVLQLHMENAAQSAQDPQCRILQEEITRLQEELVGAASSVTVLKRKLKETQASCQTRIAELTEEINTLTLDRQDKDTYIETLREDLEKEKHLLQESQMMCRHLEEKKEQLMAENSSSLQTLPAHDAASMTRIPLSPEDNGSTSGIQQQVKNINVQLHDIQMRRMDSNDVDRTERDKGVSFATEGGFEPEPDSLEYLDLAVGPKAGGDYFVEESEPSKSPKTRTKSVPSESYFEDAVEQNMVVIKLKRPSPAKDSVQEASGRFEPEEGTVTSMEEGRFQFAGELRPDSVEDSFQPESVPVSPSTHLATSAPNPSFLPHPIAVLPGTHTYNQSAEMVSSSSQTDLLPMDSLAPAVSSQESDQLQSADAVIEVSGGERSVPEDQQPDVEAEVARKLKGLQDQLEEEWVLKMRSQEVELRHTYETKFEEFKRQTEHQCQQRIKHMKRDTQASFVDAVRKMRKSMEKRQQQDLGDGDVGTAMGPTATDSKSTQDLPDLTDDDRQLGDIVKQLHQENQELAEVRDVLLQQIAISQTQGLRNTMQHELQALVAGGSRQSPQSTLMSSPRPSTAAEHAELMLVHEPPLAAAQTQAVGTSSISGEGGVQSPAEDLASQSTPTAGSDDDDDDDDGSSSSCVRERFLEELEEMSQQSGQDLPLEWELTSAAVSHGNSSGGAGIFERDLTGSGSVWEVFDGRCLRQDCRELESLKRQYEAEMEALRQQLEGQQDTSDHVEQLRSSYLQAVSNLREALQDQEQQEELDAVVGQLLELHQRQLQQLNAQHVHDTALQVRAMKVTVEQMQEGRLRLVEEQHTHTLQQLDKQHKEQLNTLRASLPPSSSPSPSCSTSPSSSSTTKDDVIPFSGSEQLTQQYQNLVQRISQSLEREVLGRLCGEDGGQDGTGDVKTNGVSSDDAEENRTRDGSPGTISKEQADAIHQVLQAQQEEVLLLRSRLLQEYEEVLQQRTQGVSQQTQEVQHLQEQIAQLQAQYDQQIADFQARISQYSEEEEQRRTEQQKHLEAMAEMKARYEQRISDMEESFSKQIASLQHAAALSMVAPEPADMNDGGDSGTRTAMDHTEDSDPDSLCLQLEPERDYVHRTATLTAISDADSDLADSPRVQSDPKPSSLSPPPPSSARLQQLQATVEERTEQVRRLEHSLEEERGRVGELGGQLDSAALRLEDLTSQLDQQRALSERLQHSLQERETELEQAQQEKAESQKLLQELTEKETGLAKEKESLTEELKCLKELDEALLTSTPTVEDELRQLKTSLEEATSALCTAEAREAELREKLDDAEHGHAEALEELRQELEHEAQMERESLQSEFLAQLDVELKRQAAELERRFAERLGHSAKNSSIPGRTVDDDVDMECLPDAPHAEDGVKAALAATLNMSPPVVRGDHHNHQDVICQSVQSLQSSPCAENAGSRTKEVDGQPQTNGTATPPCGGGANGHIAEGVGETGVGEGSVGEMKTEVVVPCGQVEEEKTQEVAALRQRVAELEALLRDAEEKYAQLKEDVEEREGAGVDTLVKDRYDMELELAKNLMQQEFDDTLQAEKKKFVERHRTLMDDFMADREMEAAEIKEKHEQELEELRSSLTTQVAQLQAQLELTQTDTSRDEKGMEVPITEEEVKGLKSELEEKEAKLESLQAEHAEALAAARGEAEGVREEVERMRAELREAVSALQGLQDVQAQLDRLREEHTEAMAALQEGHDARVKELQASQQEELEAAALDTDVVRSDLEQAHQAEVRQLREQLASLEHSLQQQQQQQQAQQQQQQDAQQCPPHTQTLTAETVAMLRHAGQLAGECYRPGPEAMHAVSEITLPLHRSFHQGARDGEATPELRSSLEYETTDEEGSVHSLSSTLGKTRSFADVVKSPLPSSPRQEERIKELEAEVERLTQQLAQHQHHHHHQEDSMTASNSTLVASPASSSVHTLTSSPPQGAGWQGEGRDGGDPGLFHMLRTDLDRISAERDAVQRTNNHLLQLLSDSVHTYVEVEDTINRRLHTLVTASAPRPHTPTHPLQGAGDLVTPRGAGLTSFMGVAGGGDRGGAIGGAGVAVSSPQSEHSWRHSEADTSSPTLEETSILSSATDEGLDMSQRLTESIFTGPDIDAEGEEIVSDARGRLQSAVSRLLEMIERTTQQLMEAKATQSQLLDTMAARTRDNDQLAARLKDLEDQVRQEVAAKEYLGLELHKAEGLISGYSSEREALEEQLQSLEEQKEGLATELETTRSRLADFQQATGELEARRLDVERQQSLLQENAGQETQESAMAGGDATVSEQQALLKEMDTVKQQTREQSLQLQHRLSQAEQRLQDREAAVEEMEKEHLRHTEDLRRQVEDLRLQLDNTERQLKANKQFLDEQMSEREQEREEFVKEVDRLKDQLHNKEKQGDSEGRLQREIQDLTEQLQARIESQSAMHQQTRELQQSLQERELSAQDLRVWIDTLERELDQRGDTEEQLKGRIQKLERRLTIGEAESQSDTSVSPVATPRPVSPSSLPLSPAHPAPQRRQSRVSLEEELRKSRQSEEELVHEKEALQKTVQEQLLQMSALRNQLDEMRHWTGTPDPNASSTSAADLREQLDTEREKLEKTEEELSKLKEDQEALRLELEGRSQEVEDLRQQLKESAVSAAHLKQLEEDRDSLQAQVSQLSNTGPFPPELLDEKNAEIEELRHQLSKTESEFGSLQAELKEKEELVSDLQDTVHSLQRGEACLDVSLSFNEPLPLNASFTERLQEEERPSSVTSLAQELDQTVGEQEARIEQLTGEVDQLTEQLSQLQHDKAALEAELQQRDDDLSQLQEERTQKQEALVEKESRLQQLVEQINSLHTEITSLTTFQVELQKDFDTVQTMLDEKEGEIESLTKELLESRSQTEAGSDVSDLEAELAAVQRQLREQRNVVDEKEEELYELNEKLEAMESLRGELQSLKAQVAEQAGQLEQQQKSNTQLEKDLSERTEELRKAAESRDSLEAELAERLQQLEQERQEDREGALERERAQVKELKGEVQHLESVLKEKEEAIRGLQEETAEYRALRDKDLANLTQQLQDSQLRLRDLEQQRQQYEEAAQQKEAETEDLRQQMKTEADTVLRLKSQQQALQQEADSHMTSITRLQREVAHLTEQLEEAKRESTATDDVKAVQEKLQQAWCQVAELQQQGSETRTRLDQTLTQLAEREDQIQQLQAELQSMQQECQRQESQAAWESSPGLRTPDSEESEERLQDALSRAQHVGSLVCHSLASSLPAPSPPHASTLSRWESEPGLASALSPELALQAHDTEMWLRRQQRELASKNRELASVRQELELWLRRKDRTAKHEFSASVMTMTLRLQEKDVLIASLKRELAEARELVERATGGETTPTPPPSSHSLSPQTKQQIAHLRSELRRAKAALTAMQEQSALQPGGGAGGGVGEGEEDGGGGGGDGRERVEQLEAELQALRSSASVSSDDFAQKVEALRQELGEEHRQHVQEVQETARRDLEARLSELQGRHEQETQQLQQLHQRRLEQALNQQQQEMEKRHKTELNTLRVQHQQEIDRLRSEELASLTESSVAQQLHADVSVTQQLDRNMIGRLYTENGASDAGSEASEPCPPHIQALLDRLREAGEHILSVSEMDLLQRHFSPLRGGDSLSDRGLQEATEAERLSLVKTIHALKELLSQSDRVGAGLEESGSDWRRALISALVEVYRQERLAMEAELHTLRLQHPEQQQQQHGDLFSTFDNRLLEQEQLQQSGLDAMLRAERQSLLTELEQLQSRLSQQRQEKQDLQAQLTDALAQQEEAASNNTWKLQREVQVLEYKLKQEQVLEEDLRKGLEAERRRVAELSSELSRDKGSLVSLQAELQSTQLHLSRTKDALDREQSRFTSVTKKDEATAGQLRREWSSCLDALEEEREKNNRLADMLETLRRQHSSLESDVGRSEALRRERETAESKFIKELQAELASEREQVQRAEGVAEEERRQRKQLEGQVEQEQRQGAAMEQELDTLRAHTSRALQAEAAKRSDAHRLLSKEQEKVEELQRSLADKEAAILQHSHHAQQLQAQVQQLKSRCNSLERDVETERRRAESLTAQVDSERQAQLKVTQQEQATSKQLRKELSQAKTEAKESRRQLELEKSHSDSLRLELERAQSELRAVTQHAGATERQLETEQSNTWKKLQLAQKDRDELQVKVHELELELDRLQDRLRDLELELDRSRQRELEARHDVERHKLYPSASPRSAPATPRGGGGGGDPQLQTRLNVFCQQLQHVGKRLQTLTLKQRDLNVSLSESDSGQTEGSKRQRALEELMKELTFLQQKMASGQLEEGDNSVRTLTQEVEELQSTVHQLQSEKQELRRQLSLLEDEDNRRTPRTPRSARSVHLSTGHQGTMPQYVSDVGASDDEVMFERTVWASERLKLQMALDSAEHEIDHLKKELRSFRGHFNSEGFMVEADRDKMQRLYGKYLRAESFRKALVYQKKYLLLLLGGYQDSEQETLAIIATMGGQPSSTLDLALRRRHRRLYTIFRSAARMVVAIFRMKYLVRKWKRAMRVGSPVVSGQVSRHYGYVATPSSFSPANNPERQPAHSATSAHVHTLQRQGRSPLCNGDSPALLPQPHALSLPAGDAGRHFFTPPTKEFSQSSHRASTSPASSAARRQLMGDLDRSHPSSSGSDSYGGGAAAQAAASHDDYIQRLENLRTRLSSSKNGEASPRQPSWR
ncbi:LOW QUALITY PROTEIN: uncharacterized protein LOC143299932 [Babylonia areolata]|uniref:LOW QUALITY PROTEIN: uncharacterized protein LOC143299932 n=1 Tax=Babylonia areolata TaxID=304850 RepID=UPI003FD28BF6